MLRLLLATSGAVLVASSVGRTVTAEDQTLTAGRFEQAGTLGETRMLHSATPLPDGRVLFVGGLGGDFTVTDGVSFLASAEAWDPSTGSSQPVGSLADARAEHTATPLPDGRVLVVGGREDAGPLASAETWDPQSGSFEPTGSLSEARFGHSATLLPDGRILVAGGYAGDDDAPASTEVWDPSTGSFEPAGSLSIPRRNHSAVLLPDARVLLVGGVDPEFSAVAAAEIWDPIDRTFEPDGSLVEARTWNATASLSDGRVLVAGGDDENGLLTSAEIWDPGSGSFSSTGSLAEGRHHGTATRLPDDRVLVAGGLGGEWGSEPLAGTEAWDPRTGSFEPAGTLLQPRMSHTATLLTDGRVLVAGGTADHTDIFATVEVWEPADR